MQTFKEFEFVMDTRKRRIKREVDYTWHLATTNSQDEPRVRLL